MCEFCCHLLIKLFISAVQFELMLCKSQNIHQELMPKNVAKYHVPNAMAIYNFGFYKKAKIWYVIMSSFFEYYFWFWHIYGIRKVLIRWDDESESIWYWPNIEHIVTDYFYIFFPLLGYLKYNLLSRFKKASKQRYRIVLAIAAFNISMIRKNLVILFFFYYNPTCYAI